jgi:hypothetical protein
LATGASLGNRQREGRQHQQLREQQQNQEYQQPQECKQQKGQRQHEGATHRKDKVATIKTMIEREMMPAIAGMSTAEEY